MAFYAEMQDMVRDLLQPDSQGGLGQGAIAIVRETPGVPSPSAPWVPVVPSKQTEKVNQIGKPKAEYVSQGTIIVTDTAFMIEPPATLVPDVGDRVLIGGVDVGGIVHVERLGSFDVAVYFSIYVNR